MTARGRLAVFLTKQLPYPADSGGRLRSAALVDVFRERFDEVHVVGFGAAAGPDVPPGVTLHGAARSATLRGAARTGSIAMGRWYHPRLRRTVAALADGDTHVHVDFVHMLANLPRLGVLDSLDMHNVESDLLAQRARAEARPLMRGILAVESTRLRAWERRAAAAAPVTCCSDGDRRRLEALGIRVAAVAPNGAAVPARAPQPAPRPHLVYVGALDWHPNVEGLAWFVEHVWPRIRRACPDLTLSLVGRRPGRAVRALTGSGIDLAADVPSVEPYYGQASVAICPLLTGGGSRLKIVEAAAHARPVVATERGAEGMESLSGRGLVVAQGPESFAAAVVALVTNPGAAESLGRRAREQVEANWSWGRTLAPAGALLDAQLAMAVGRGDGRHLAAGLAAPDGR